MGNVVHWIKDFASLFVCLCLFSCAPAINSFDVNERTITNEDSVIVTWDASGKTSLLFHEHQISDSDGFESNCESAKFLEYTLVVSRSGKEVRRTIQVVLLPKETTDSIIFISSLSENGDSLIAHGEKNSKRWGNNFRVLSVASASSRMLYVSHGGNKFTVDGDGFPTNAFAGTTLEGDWSISSPLTSTEKSDPSALPEFLRLNLTIQYKKTSDGNNNR